MNEKPIIFSTQMVQAIMSGKKTQTRRIVKGHALTWLDNDEFTPEYVAMPENTLCPYGYRGDHLWVRESFFELVDPHTSKCFDPPQYMYRASYNPETDGEVFVDDGDGGMTINKDGTTRSPWKPPIHMPRAAARLMLEVLSVRIERLNEISDDDAIAEGVMHGEQPAKNIGGLVATMVVDARSEFASIWYNIHGEDSWNENPWVWVIEFKKL